MEQGLFLQKLSDALEESKNKITFPLKTRGFDYISNNYFWLHGRKNFGFMNLSREFLIVLENFLN